MEYDFNKEGYYLRIDEKSNTIDSLDKLLYFLQHVDVDNVFYWKWAMIALHNCFYSSMILCLIGANPQNIITNKKQHTDDKAKILSFYDALKRVQNPTYMNLYDNSKCLAIEHNQYNSIEHLNDLIRNQFMHYKPALISYGIGGFLEIINDVLPMTRFLLTMSGNIRLNEEEVTHINNTIDEVDRITKKIIDDYRIK
ncbi:MAG: hypothetical protein GF365_04860 [Candidatus Buchananbacteria bacterium]|nr:hypothetical protein [Candidatus Buchananbacteria bacterium]